MSNFFENDFGRFFRHRASSRSPPRDSGTDGGTGMVSAVGTTTILPIADRSPARAIPLQNAYSDRVDQYDTISVHTAISSQNEQSVQNGAISPRIITLCDKMNLLNFLYIPLNSVICLSKTQTKFCWT